MKSLRLILIDIEIDIYVQNIKSAKSYNFAPRFQSIAHQYLTRFSKPNRKNRISEMWNLTWSSFSLEENFASFETLPLILKTKISFSKTFI